MGSIARNNAFGAGSPSWNLSFPEGNLTAAEILAYLPHWLKSVDVILRFVNHGGRSVTITYLLDNLRVMPSSNYQANSTTVMMHYAMRRAGKQEWTIGTRHEFADDREYPEDSLYVGDFRPPRLTHPKSASARQKLRTSDLTRNSAAAPIPFKDLALHVKKHPSGDDALDLTRCVDYALKHPDEEWLFPIDFGKLVDHLGGPLPVTHSHLDKQLFARYDTLFKAHGPARAPAKYNKKPAAKRKAVADTTTESESEATKTVMRQARDSMMASTASPTFGKRALDDLDGGNDDEMGIRRSTRRLRKAPVYIENDDATVQFSVSGHCLLILNMSLRRLRHLVQTMLRRARSASSHAFRRRPRRRRATSKRKKSLNLMTRPCLLSKKLTRTLTLPQRYAASVLHPAKRARSFTSSLPQYSWSSSVLQLPPQSPLTRPSWNTALR